MNVRVFEAAPPSRHVIEVNAPLTGVNGNSLPSEMLLIIRNPFNGLPWISVELTDLPDR